MDPCLDWAPSGSVPMRPGAVLVVRRVARGALVPYRLLVRCRVCHSHRVKNQGQQRAEMQSCSHLPPPQIHEVTIWGQERFFSPYLTRFRGKGADGQRFWGNPGSECAGLGLEPASALVLFDTIFCMPRYDDSFTHIHTYRHWEQSRAPHVRGLFLGNGTRSE